MFKKLTNYFVRGKKDNCRCIIKEGDSDERFTMSPGELKRILKSCIKSLGYPSLVMCSAKI